MPGDFNFDLSSEQEARAKRLHADSIVFDWLSQHVGGPNIFEHYPPNLRKEFDDCMSRAGVGFEGYLEAMYWPYEMEVAGKSELLRQWYLQSGLTCGTHSIPVVDGDDPAVAWLEAKLARFQKIPWLRYVTTAAEIRQAKINREIALYAHWQPVTPIPRNLKAIDRAYERGLRSLMLTYNRMDHVGVGCTERVDAGLSNYGVDVVRRCEELGVIVDTSHCGHLTTMDACRQAKRPVNANHTCAKAVCDVARAKSDDALKAIADTGGVIGVVTVPFFLSRSNNPSIAAMLDQIEYIANLVGWRHVSIGTDWPSQTPDEIQKKMLGPVFAEIGFRPEDRVEIAQRTIGFGDYRDMPNITRGLVARGFSDEQIVAILGENALRVFAEICG
jgi:membrane dipeptidase